MKHFTDAGTWPGRVARHNLVYLTPATDPLDGWALGNGEMGALFWTGPDSLVAVVNRADLVEPAATPRRCFNWSREDEEHTATQRHGGRLVWRFPVPLFDTLYLKDFRAELDIALGELRIFCASAFGSLELTAFVPEGGQALRVRMKRDFRDCAPVSLVLERLGSRVFGHWYSQIRNSPEAGLDGCSCRVSGKGMTLVKSLSESSAFAVTAWSQAAFMPRRLGACAGECSLPASTGDAPGQSEETFAVLTPPGASPEEAEALAARLLLQERRRPWDRRSRQTREAWRSFWSASWVDCGDAYLNQLWHLQLFYLNAAQRGRFPARFIGSIWSWQRDFQAWHHVFHWNQQML